MQKSNLNTSQSINTGKEFKILNTKYIYSILSSNLNTCILNTDQHWSSSTWHRWSSDCLSPLRRHRSSNLVRLNRCAFHGC